MTASGSALHRGSVRLYLRILAGAAVVGAVYGAAIAPQLASMAMSLAIGVANGMAIAACIAGIEIFVLREGGPARRLPQLPFAALLLLKTVLYAGIVSLFVIGAPRLAALLPSIRAFYRPLDAHATLATIGFSLAMTLVIVMLLQASALLPVRRRDRLDRDRRAARAAGGAPLPRRGVRRHRRADPRLGRGKPLTGAYSITWSARSRIACGMVAPSSRAALRFTTSSMRAGCSVASSPDFAPFRIRST